MKHLPAILVSVAAVFAPIEGMLVTAATLILSDFVLGVAAAHKQKEPITSAGFRRTLSKLVVYEVALMLGYLAEHYMMGGLPITKLVGGVISLTEIKSIYENLNVLSGTDLLKSVLDKLGSSNGGSVK